jgi:hypothetical protein
MACRQSTAQYSRNTPPTRPPGQAGLFDLAGQSDRVVVDAYLFKDSPVSVMRTITPASTVQVNTHILKKPRDFLLLLEGQLTHRVSNTRAISRSGDPVPSMTSG